MNAGSASLESTDLPAARGERAGAASLGVPVALAVVGSTSIVVGLLWDISWHRSIGRDTFWTPAHMAIYLGGLLAGAAAGWLVLRATFGPESERAAAVSVGPLRGPLGAFLMIWGAVAMLASAPFDDWWHNAYGLDVRVLSPPHAVLAAGMIVVAMGALVLAVSTRNRLGASRARDLAAIFAGGMLVTLAATFVIEFTFPLHQHSAIFYEVAGAAFPIFLVGAARALPGRRSATAAALVYMGVVCAMNWILPLFPATPMLAPIYNPITRMVPFCFPILLVFPAMAIDALLARSASRERSIPSVLLALVLGVAFFLVLLAVQWPFAIFQMTPASRNWFFGGDRFWSYSFQPDAKWRYGFDPVAMRLDAAGAALATGLASLSSWLGLVRGNWLARVLR
jgi:hypothetical protein